MKKEEELKRMLDNIHYEFGKEKYDVALLKLEKVGKFLIASLNAYNKKH